MRPAWIGALQAPCRQPVLRCKALRAVCTCRHACLADVTAVAHMPAAPDLSSAGAKGKSCGRTHSKGVLLPVAAAAAVAVLDVGLTMLIRWAVAAAEQRRR